ncbi:Bifunctional protein GlmU [compost metagenome]
MREGVTLTAAETVYFSADTDLEADVRVEPCVVFGPGVQVARGACVSAFSHLQNVRIEPAGTA